MKVFKAVWYWWHYGRAGKHDLNFAREYYREQVFDAKKENKSSNIY